MPPVERKTVKLDARRRVEGAVVAMGNPQFVALAENKEFVGGRARVAGNGRGDLHASRFSCADQCGVCAPAGGDLIEIRIYERGVGPTSSSGTGTSASAAVMMALEGAPTRLRVLAPGGEQRVEWPSASAELRLTGRR